MAVANTEGRTMNNATDWFKRATAKHKSKDYQGAIADYTKAIELNPDYAQAYNKRGFAYLMLGSKSKARADFKRAIELGYCVPQEALDACK